jgi:hypothetical protein
MRRVLYGRRELQGGATIWADAVEENAVSNRAIAAAKLVPRGSWT